MSKRCCAKMCFNSQTTNKSVTYFGFPKYVQFASKWATAAGREDLLEKKLDSIIKYFLCSEHFTDDCFTDPPHNTRLKKTSHPVTVPIPTIFKCNIDKYIPNMRPQQQTITMYQTSDDSITSTTAGTLANQDKQFSNDFHVKTMNQTQPNMDYQELPFGSSLLKNNNINNNNNNTNRTSKNSTNAMTSVEDIDNIIVNICDTNQTDDLTNMHTFDHMDALCLPHAYDINLIIEEDTSDFSTTDILNTDTDDNTTNPGSDTAIYVCRMCLMVFVTDDGLIKIADSPGLCEKIDKLLPNNIGINDDLPQLVCTDCIKKVNNCIEIINDFQETQNELRRIYDLH